VCSLGIRSAAYRPNPTPRSFASASTIAAPEGIERAAEPRNDFDADQVGAAGEAAGEPGTD
jgi:hypothetical protein